MRNNGNAINDRIASIAAASRNSGTLCYISGTGHCGSTLLDLLLNNSPEVQSVGEFFKLNLNARTNKELCTCGQPVIECSFWLGVQRQAQRDLGLEEDTELLKTVDVMLIPAQIGIVTDIAEKLLLIAANRPLYMWYVQRFAKPHHLATVNSLFWNEMVRRASGARVIVDSGKNPRRLKALYLTDPQPFRLVFMVRDGRAVAASAMRREKVDMELAASEWVAAKRRASWAHRGIPASKTLTVRYEDLCADPAPTVKRLCSFLGIPYNDQMLKLNKQDAHHIGGNPMRFAKEETSIRLDERWRRQLSSEDLRRFERIAGSWNRRFGYE